MAGLKRHLRPVQAPETRALALISPPLKAAPRGRSAPNKRSALCRRNNPRAPTKRNEEMPAIGSVTKLEDGSFKGQLLSINAEPMIHANDRKTNDAHPTIASSPATSRSA